MYHQLGCTIEEYKVFNTRFADISNTIQSLIALAGHLLQAQLISPEILVTSPGLEHLKYFI